MEPRWLALLIAVTLATAWGCKDPAEDPPGDDDDVGAQSVPLTVAIDSPADGWITDASTVHVQGSVTGEDPQVTVNGQPATVDGGSFEADVAVDPGAPTLPLLAEATDESGWARDRRTVLIGQATPASQPVDQGLALRLTDDGLDGLEPVLEGMMPPSMIEQMILDSNPLYTGIVDIYADGASIASVELDLDADTGGLVLSGSLVDMTLDLSVDAGWAGIWPGTAHAARVDMTGEAVLSTAAGQLVVSVQDVVVEIVDLTLDFEDVWDWIDEAIAWMVPAFLEGFAEDLITDEAAAAIDGLLTGLTEGFELGGITVELAFDTVSHDAVGVTVVTDLTISGGGGDTPADRVRVPGALPELWHTETPGGTPFGGQLVLDDDALNAIGIALDGSGLLEQTMEGEIPGAGMPLQAGLFYMIFPSLEDALDDDAALMLETEPTVPAVGVAAAGPDGVAKLYLAGLMVTIGGDLDGDGDMEPIYRVAVDGVLDLAVDPGGDLDIGADDLTATLIWADVEAERTEGEGLAGLLDVAIGMFVGDLTAGLLDLIPGIHLAPLEGGALGPELDHACLYANLEPAP